MVKLLILSAEQGNEDSKRIRLLLFLGSICSYSNRIIFLFMATPYRPHSDASELAIKRVNKL